MKNSCEFLSSVKTSEPIHLTSIDPEEERRLAHANENAYNYYQRGFDSGIRKAAMEKGANIVVTDLSSVGPMTKTLHGKAYKCKIAN